MKLKRYERYQIDFSGKMVIATCAFLGMSLFLRILHYFFLGAFSVCSTAELIFLIILPAFAVIVYIVLMRCIRWNAPGVYGIIGCVFCLLLMGWNFASGNTFRIVLSVIWYLLSALMLLAVSGGFFPARILASSCFLFALLARILFFDAGEPSLQEWIPEASDLCILLSQLCFPLTLKTTRHKATE